MQSLVRLTPDQPGSWAAWPVLEARVLAAMAAMGTEAPPQRIIAYMRQLWGTNPMALGAWLAYTTDASGNGHGPAPVIGHAVAWTDTHWGESVLFAFQIVADPGVGSELRVAMLLELDRWRVGINETMARANRPERITRVKFSTERDLEAYARWLRPYVDVRPLGSALIFDLSTLRIPEVEPA